ncbi:hypothetical protein [Luteipulveratus mongoliensis]|uniref:Uncharacterized protein n=1 Tax=Luteipulveratus mongoliensis TaxID=571913 RepID=A0A0K1JGG1_9MICO|nr:hypothetical protein [Luteipulveratus mongoliensis]AKU15690.1 hypothetical protein VV02_07230 [Luteipulveratus mongoliensis]
MSRSDWSDQQWEQHHREVYAPDRVAKGEQPRNLADYRATAERMEAIGKVGAAWEAEIGRTLGLQPVRGWRTRTYYDTGRGARFHDHAVDFEIRVAIEAKAGRAADHTAQQQLQKDARLLERRGVAIWLVEDLAKLPPPALERARELERTYPETFMLREVTDLSRERAFDEVGLLLRGQELKHFEVRAMQLADDLAIAREELEQRTEHTPAADLAAQRVRDMTAELERVTLERDQITLDLDATRARVTERERRLDRAVAQAEQRYEARGSELAEAVEGIAETRDVVRDTIRRVTGRTGQVSRQIEDDIARDRSVRAPVIELATHHDRLGTLRRDLDRLDLANQGLQDELTGRHGPPDRAEVRADLERRDWQRRTLGTASLPLSEARASRTDPISQARQAFDEAERDLTRPAAPAGARITRDHRLDRGFGTDLGPWRSPPEHEIDARVGDLRSSGLDPATIRERVVSQYVQQRSPAVPPRALAVHGQHRTLARGHDLER